MVSYKSGGHLNPAVTLGIVFTGAKEFVPGVAVSAASIATYIAAQFVGAFIGAVACWLAYKKQFDADAPRCGQARCVLDRS
ncbi:aquaporin [Propioniciclava flava]